MSAPAPKKAPAELAEDAPGASGSTGLAVALPRLAWPLAFVAIAAMGFGHFRAPPPPAQAEKIVVRSTPTVVKELRALGRLETAALHVEKVVDVSDHQVRLFGLVEAQDTLLYVASGELVLGVDLGKLEDKDTRFDPVTRVAHVRLPEPELFSSRLDELNSRVYTHDTELLARRSEALESIARRQALAAFAEAANAPQARDLARRQAEHQLRALARAWGAEDLIVTWRASVTAENAIAPSP